VTVWVTVLVLVLVLVLTLVLTLVSLVEVVEVVVVVVGSVVVVVVVVVGSVVVAVVVVVGAVRDVTDVALPVIGVRVVGLSDGMPAVRSLTRPKTISAMSTAPAAPKETSATGLRYQGSGAGGGSPGRP
jgi:hypothetical protein